MKKILLISALVLFQLGMDFLYADSVTVGGYYVYSNFLAQQTRFDNERWTDVTVRHSDWWQWDNAAAGRMQLNFQYNGDDLSFITSLRYDDQASLTSAAETSNYPVAFGGVAQMNLTYSLFDKQLKLRTGKYEEESLGYMVNQPLMGIWRNLVSAHGGGSDSRYLTSVEWIPQEIDGLQGFSVLFGVPIDPETMFPSSTDSASEEQEIASHVYSRFRLAAKYQLQDVGTLYFSWFNKLYSYMENEAAHYATNTDIVYNHHGEGINEGEIGITNVKFLDASWMFAFYYQNNRAADYGAFNHHLLISYDYDVTPDMKLNIDGQFSALNKEWGAGDYCYSNNTDYDLGDQHISANMKDNWSFNYEVVAQLTQKIEGNIILGAKTTAYYEPTTYGHFWLWDQPFATFKGDADGSKGSEVYLNFEPYVQFNMGQGNVVVGFEELWDYKRCYQTSSNSYLNSSCLSWRVPVSFFMWF